MDVSAQSGAVSILFVAEAGEVSLYPVLQGGLTGAGVRFHGLDLLLAEQRPQRGLGGLDGGAVHHRGLEALPGRGALQQAVLLPGAGTELLFHNRQICSKDYY